MKERVDAFDEREVRAVIFDGVPIERGLKLSRYNSFTRELGETHHALFSVFRSGYDRNPNPTQTELVKSCSKMPDSIIEKIITRRVVEATWEYNGDYWDANTRVYQDIWFKRLEDAELFYHKLDTSEIKKKARAWSVTLCARESCIKMSRFPVMLAAEEIFSGTEGSDALFIYAHNQETGLDFPKRKILASAVATYPATDIIPLTVTHITSRIDSMLGIFAPAKAEPKEFNLLSFLEKFNVAPEIITQTKFIDLGITGAIEFPDASDMSMLEVLARTIQQKTGIESSVNPAFDAIPYLKRGPKIDMWADRATIEQWVNEHEAAASADDCALNP